MAANASSIVAGKRSENSSTTGRREVTESPKSSRITFSR